MLRSPGPRTRFVLVGLLGGLTLLSAPAAFATVHTVTQSGNTFDPPDIIIAQGDTVQWNWTSGVHTVTSGSGPSDPQVGVLFDAPLTSADPTFAFVFTQLGVIDYFCRPHFLLAMTGTITVVPAIHTITQSSLVFLPGTIDIEIGDAVQWLHTSGTHTVTSGFGAADPGVGTLFDVLFDAANPIFTYVFDDTIGTYPYFCRPHELAGMRGIVRVKPLTSVDEEPPAAIDATWGRMKELTEDMFRDR